MIGRIVLGALVLLSRPAAAADCPPENDRLLFHSCHGAATAELLLLPEEADGLSVPRAQDTLVVGGGYTGTDFRPTGSPNPVGVFVDDGRVVNPNLARMDGILVIDPQGQPAIHHASRVPTMDGVTDLTEANQRLAFANSAAEHGFSVMQSHLLIVEGEVDVRQQPGAPSARRRILFSGPGGWGVYQTSDAQTLFDASWELRQRFRPDMALNLDMGSYDYCVQTREGVARACGVLGASQIEKLSNLLRFTRP